MPYTHFGLLMNGGMLGLDQVVCDDTRLACLYIHSVWEDDTVTLFATDCWGLFFFLFFYRYRADQGVELDWT